MRLAIIGSRSVNDKEKVFSLIRENIGIDPVVIISGGAGGVDSFAKEYAQKNCIDYIEYLPNFKISNRAYNRKDYLIRNRQIIDNCDRLLAIWDKKSTGTKYTFEIAKKLGKQVIIYEI